MDPDGRIVEFNPASEHCFGYRRQDVIGLMLAEMIVPEQHREAHHRGLQHYLKTGEGPVLRKRIEIEALRKDGSVFPVELAIDVARSLNEELFVAYLRDITERKHAEDELRRSQEELSKLALLAARTDNAVVFTDREGRIEWINDGFTRITGWPLDEILGRKPGDFLQGPETDPAAVRYMGESIRAGRGFSSELINYHRDGGKYWTAIEA